MRGSIPIVTIPPPPLPGAHPWGFAIFFFTWRPIPH